MRLALQTFANGTIRYR